MRTSRSGTGVWNSTNIALFFLVVTFSTSLSALVLPLPGDLPPDPGIGGETTIEGVDVNSNGVRDDVELAIFDSHPNNPAAREILYHMAIYYQTLLIHRQTASVVLDSVGYLVALAPCLEIATGTPSVGDSMLRPNVLNTYDRSMAYIDAMEAMNATVTIPARTVTCSTLPTYPVVPPGVPSSIIVPATNATGTYVISWGTATGTVGRYELQQDITNNFAAPINSYSGTSLSRNVTVTHNGTYYYRVRACNENGCSNYRNGSNGVVVSAPPPNTPTAISALKNSSGGILVTWSSATGLVTQYELQEKKSIINGFVAPNCNFTSISPVVYSGLNLTTTLTNKSSNYLYCYRVRACNSNGCSSYGPTATAKTGK